jgi:hypothetical protein
MVELLIDYKLQMIFEEAFVAKWSYYPAICLEVLKKAMEDNQDCRVSAEIRT